MAIRKNKEEGKKWAVEDKTPVKLSQAPVLSAIPHTDRTPLQQKEADSAGKKRSPLSGFLLGLGSKLTMKKNPAKATATVKEEGGKEGYSRPVAGEKKKIPRHRHLLQYTLKKSGFDIDDEALIRYLFIGAGVIAGILTLVAFFSPVWFSFLKFPSLLYALFLLFTIWVFVFPAAVLILFLCVFLYLDFLKYKRRLAIEEVLPDFLQLASANIRAGMTIDKALWYAVRPQFGVLAKEIEVVAKQVISGYDLNDSLKEFSKKYDSEVLERTINLLTEGMEAGGEIGELLNKLANDITESRIMQKEMAANVMSYVIFIGFATVVAAPLLFGLSYTLLTIITGLTSTLTGSIGDDTTGMPFSVSGQSINPHDFIIFAILMITVTSLFSAMIISTIRYGDARRGLKLIPGFIIVAVIIFFISLKMFGGLMAGII